MPFAEIARALTDTIGNRLTTVEHTLDKHVGASAQWRTEVDRREKDRDDAMRELRADVRAMLQTINTLEQKIADRDGVQKAVMWMISLFVGLSGLLIYLINHFTGSKQ